MIRCVPSAVNYGISSRTAAEGCPGGTEGVAPLRHQGGLPRRTATRSVARMETVHLTARLAAEYRRRRGINPRYSLRAFARALGTHHSTLSQILQGRRRLTSRAVRRLGPRLGMSPAEIAEACLDESCAAILRLVADRRFRPSSRWIATMTGIPLDDVNLALHRLLYRRQLVMRTTTSWTTGDPT